MTHSCQLPSITAADHESDVYTRNREWGNEMRLDAQSDFYEWANHVVAAIRTHRLRFGESAAKASAQHGTGLRRWASHMLTKIED
jgi:hypothetical protein